MRYLLPLLLFTSPVSAQAPEIDDTIKQKLAAIRFVQSLEDPKGGFFPTGKETKPTLRGTSAAVRALKYLTGKAAGDAVPHARECAEFVLSCYDPKTGGFADTPGGKPDVYLTAVGVMAAMELGIPKQQFAKAMDYLKDNAKSFEDVRIGAAAVEAWGVKDCPFKLEAWFAVGEQFANQKLEGLQDGGARDIGSYVAFRIRLGQPFAADRARDFAVSLARGQRTDGGWGKKGEGTSDLETSYRVMRSFYLLKAAPADAAKLRAFIAKCRNSDGGYGTKPGEPSSVGGVYFAAVMSIWLSELEKK